MQPLWNLDNQISGKPEHLKISRASEAGKFKKAFI
jgi:hypothetical protein